MPLKNEKLKNLIFNFFLNSLFFLIEIVFHFDEIS